MQDPTQVPGVDTRSGHAAEHYSSDSPSSVSGGSGRAFPPDVTSKGHAMMSPEAIWEAHDQADFLLQLDASRADMLRRVEGAVTILTVDLERRIAHYSSVHGARTPEGRVAMKWLATARTDLSWVNARRHVATAADMRNKLRHALRSSVNGLTLLSWSLAPARDEKRERAHVPK